MRSIPPAITALLPNTVPDNADARLLLFSIRRIGAHGIDDAHAAHAFLKAFGKGFRRPLVLIRTFMHELATTAAQPITIAPCCCGRMTPSETALLSIISCVEADPARADLLLRDLLGVQGIDSVAMSAGALAAAFADAGRPISA